MKSLNKFLLSWFFVGGALASTSTISSQVFSSDISDKKLVREYLKKLDSFSKSQCKGGVEEKFWEKYKEFKGNGNFIPLLPDQSLDKKTVNKFIPELQNKKKWISSKIVSLKSKKNFKLEYAKIKNLEKGLDDLLLLKRDFYLEQDLDKKTKIRNKSKYQYLAYREELKSYIESLDFLVSYRFPIDHLELRLTYDKYKTSLDLEGKRKSNEVYFYRKIVQDGAQNPDHKKSDRFLRATLDTLYLGLSKQSDFVEENIRFDLAATFDAIEWHLKSGVKYQLTRLGEWHDRVERALSFYTMLRDGKISESGHSFSTSNLLERRSKARYVLKDHVLKKEAQAYKYWMNQPDILQAIYVIDTILFNEVGGIDGRDMLERRDVAQVVINRYYDKIYNGISEKESLYPYLELEKETIASNPWLNVMLKEGEFSFTYFFIPGNLRIFCPDKTRMGKFLRRENISIALSLLKRPNTEFEAVRYFSRASMLGRIDMSDIWTDFKTLEERPGKKVSRSNYLAKKYAKGEYTFHYDFTTARGENFQVIKIGKKVYVADRIGKHFYKYRNPHYFRYFKTVQ
ncbi:hypothetical protein [Halobacteriovorax sp. HLS]|uniref:hypothetical protein n=1 Tax=Halobacteriovorax sp. HLS TaxID=2234000 RepID=UPI000FDA612F|nr:hypothetical protein [Halobacteriovorax sp. HLS]